MITMTANGTEPVELKAVKASVKTTWNAICGAAPLELGSSRTTTASTPEVVGVISFIGDNSFTLSCGFNSQSAPEISRKFTGMEIEFDSGDMGEVVCELVNVLAGDVVAELDRHGSKVQMSLPMVVRGNPVELVAERDSTARRIEFDSEQGPFWVQVTSTRGGHRQMRMPGRS